VDNDKSTWIISKMGTYSELLEKTPKTGYYNKKLRSQLRRKLFCIEYNLIGRNINIDDIK